MYFNFPELLFLFLKGMTGTLSPFCYLVQYQNAEKFNLPL